MFRRTLHRWIDDGGWIDGCPTKIVNVVFSLLTFPIPCLPCFPSLVHLIVLLRPFAKKKNTPWVYIFAHCVFLCFPIMCTQHQMMINVINSLIDFCLIPSMYYVIFLRPLYVLYCFPSVCAMQRFRIMEPEFNSHFRNNQVPR